MAAAAVIPALATNAISLAKTYGPQVYEQATKMLSQTTNGKVKSMSDVVSYVGKSQQRMTVVANTLIQSGMRADEVFPLDIVQAEPSLRLLREQAVRLGERMRSAYDAGADRTVPVATPEDTVADVIRLRRAKVALEVFGSEERYFLCNPNGGIPAGDFAHLRSVRAELRR